MWMSVWGPGRGPSDQKTLEQSKLAGSSGAKSRALLTLAAAMLTMQSVEHGGGGQNRPKHLLNRALERLSPLHPPHPNPHYPHNRPTLTRKMKKKRKHLKKKKAIFCLQPLCSLLLPSAWALMEDRSETSIHTWHTAVFNTAILHAHCPSTPTKGTVSITVWYPSSYGLVP